MLIVKLITVSNISISETDIISKYYIEQKQHKTKYMHS